MSLPYEGDSSDQNVPGITGINTAGGTAVLGQSTGGVAGSFLGDVAVTGNITAQDIVLAGQINVGLTPNPGAVVVNDSHGNAGVKLDGGTLGGSISVAGTATIGNTLSVTGKVSALGDLTVTGNVGVGTASPGPSFKLQVDGNLDLLNWGEGYTIGSGQAGMYMPLNTVDLRFKTSNADRLTILSGGNVGIGTAGPADKLHVLAEGNGGGIVIQNTPTNDTTSGLSALKLVTRAKGGNDKTWALYTAATGGGFGVQPNAFEIWEYPETQPRFQINPGGDTLLVPKGGNVGVGTAAPSARLSVVAPGSSEIAGSTRSATLLTSSGALGQMPGVANEVVLASFGLTVGNNLSLGVRAIRTAAGTDWSSTAIGLGMDVDNTPRAGAALFLHANGGVGIGTTGPQGRLDVAGLVRLGLDENGSGPKTISFSRDPNDEGNAGKINYKGFDPNALCIVGAGALPRKTRIFDDLAIDRNLTVGSNVQIAGMAQVGGPVNVGADLSVGGNMFIHGTDLQLNGRGGGTKRALVDGGDGLIINFAQDYANGVEINGVVVTDDLLVNGNLTVTGHKGFRIDHPLDPDNKYLNHFCVESSEAKNLYDGRAKLNENGEAVVELPAWFQAINKNFQYQLTALGKFAPLYIADELRNDRFTIAGGEPDMEICWQVTGVRNDAYVQAHPTVVEEGKI